MNYNNITPSEELPKVEKIIFSLAWRFTKTYPISYEECLSEGYMAFMKACQDYNPERGQAFSSWVYYWVWCKLKDLVTKRTRDPHVFMEVNDDLLGEVEMLRSDALDLFDDLSGDAKEIVQLILETPADLLGGQAVSAQGLLKKVKRYLISKGRSPQALEDAHKEIKIKFNTAWA